MFDFSRTSKRQRRVLSNLTRAMMEALDVRRLFAIDLEFLEVALPVTNNTILQGQTVQIDVNMRNLGTTPTSAPFTIGAKLLGYSIVSPAESLILQFDDPNAVSFGTLNYTLVVPAGSAAQVATINGNVPSNLPPGIYALLIKVDTANTAAESEEGNNEGGFLDIAVLSSGGQLVITGTTGSDSLTLRRTETGGPHMEVEVSDRIANYSLSAVTSVFVNARQGDDLVIATGLIPSLRVDGFDGNDKLLGGDGDDTLIGGANKDTLFGGLGNDRLNGNGGNDRLFGEAGVDRIYGYEGADYLDGGSSGDRLEGGGGLDNMLGQGGNDKFFAKDGVGDDTLYGGTGSDTALVDIGELLFSIENASA